MNQGLLTVLETASCYQKYLHPYLQQTPVMSCIADMIAARARDDLRCSVDGAPLFRIFPTAHGSFLLIPRPETHPASQSWSFDEMKRQGRFSFVAFWIHPQWSTQRWEEQVHAFAQTQRGGTGLPNASPVRSEVKKPERYYHSIRDLETTESLTVLRALREQLRVFVEQEFQLPLSDDPTRGASCFVQYPNGPIKSTLHVHLWHNYQERQERGRQMPLDALLSLLSADLLALRSRVFCYQIHSASYAYQLMSAAPRFFVDPQTVIVGAQSPSDPEGAKAIDLLSLHGVERLLRGGVLWGSPP